MLSALSKSTLSINAITRTANQKVNTFHCSCSLKSRFPPLQTRISRPQTIKNNKKIKKLKALLGSKYAVIGRDKRHSPLTHNTNSSSHKSQLPPPIQLIGSINRFLATTTNRAPPPIIPLNLQATLSLPTTPTPTTTPTSTTSTLPTTPTSTLYRNNASIRMPVIDRVVDEIFTNSATFLSLSSNALPALSFFNSTNTTNTSNSGSISGTTTNSTNTGSIREECKSVSGPFYQHGILPSETGLILHAAPSATQAFQRNDEVGEEAEILRRITSLDSASSKSIKKFNTSRMCEVFGRHPSSDTTMNSSKSTVECKSVSGPFYQHGILPSETGLILHAAPSATQAFQRNDEVGEEAEILRRITSLDSASSKSIKKFNTSRMCEVFGRHPSDTGSPEVQVAVMMVKINEMKRHLSANAKDKSTKRRLEAWVSKQAKMLKYLRIRDLGKFVGTCEAIGIDPSTIRAGH